MDPREVKEAAGEWIELNNSLEGGDEFTPFWYFGRNVRRTYEEMYILHPQVTLRYDPAFFPYGILVHGVGTYPRFFNEDATRILAKIMNIPKSVDNLCDDAESTPHVKAFLDELVDKGYVVRGIFNRIGYAISDREPLKTEPATQHFPVPYPVVPHRTMLYLTYQCNVDCKHCGVRKDTSLHLTGEQWIAVLDKLEKAGVYEITLNGGEPLLHPDIHAILKRISNTRLHCRLFTNGTLLDTVMDQLYCANNFFLSVSLDGATASVHDDFRGKKGTFSKVIDAFEMLQKAPHDIPRIAACVIHKKNVDQLEDVIELALQYNLWGVGFISMNYFGKARTSGYYLSVQEHPEILENLREISKKYEEKLYISIQGRGPTLKIPERNMPDFYGNKFVCNSGILEWCLDPAGNVFPCEIVVTFTEEQQKQFTYGNMVKQSLSDIWNSKKFALFRGEYSPDDLTACTDCSFYEKCMSKKCRLYALSTTGDFHGPSYECQFSQCDLGIDYFTNKKEKNST